MEQMHREGSKTAGTCHFRRLYVDAARDNFKDAGPFVRSLVTASARLNSSPNHFPMLRYLQTIHDRCNYVVSFNAAKMIARFENRNPLGTYSEQRGIAESLSFIATTSPSLMPETLGVMRALSNSGARVFLDGILDQIIMRL